MYQLYTFRETHAVLWEHGRERVLEELQTNNRVRRIHEIILAHLVRTEEHLANACKNLVVVGLGEKKNCLVCVCGVPDADDVIAL